jgi:hypothetical protein
LKMDIAPVNLNDPTEGAMRMPKPIASNDFSDLLGQISSQAMESPTWASASNSDPSANGSGDSNSASASGTHGQTDALSRKGTASDDNAKPSKRADDRTNPNLPTPGAVAPPPQAQDQPDGQGSATAGEGQSGAAAAVPSASIPAASSDEAAVATSASSSPALAQMQGLANAALTAVANPLGAAATSLNLAASGLALNVTVQSAAKSTGLPTATNPGVQAALLDPANQGRVAGPVTQGAGIEDRPAGAEPNPSPPENPLANGPGMAPDQAAIADLEAAASNGSAASAAVMPTENGPSISGKAGDGDGQNSPAVAPASIGMPNGTLQALGPQPLQFAQPIAVAQNTAGAVAASATSPAVEQVAMHIAKAASDGVNHIQIQLSPQNLGGVEVHLEVAHDGHVLAAVSADRPDTLNLLQHDAHGLEQALKDAGLRADTGGLSFSLRDQGSASYQAPPQSAGTGPLTTTSVESTSAAAPAPVSFATSARPGGVDIQV